MSILDEHADLHPDLFDPLLPPVLFYGQNHPQWRLFSNFASTPITMPHPFSGELVTYPTVEHYFQARKATTAGDHDWIKDAVGAGQAKRRGSRRGEQLPNGSVHAITLCPEWDEMRFTVMLDALAAKFARPETKAVLSASGRSYIAEDSPFDFVWGWRSRDGEHNGQNLLGLALMMTRAEL